MAIHDSPQYRYSLFEKWDKDTFRFIKRLAHTRKYPQILGKQEDKNQFLTSLIRSQKSLHGWRTFLKETLNQVRRKGIIDTRLIHNKYPPESVSDDVPTWVTYPADKIVSDFIDELGQKKVHFIGSDQDIAEFILRFTLGQLGHDWKSTIMMIWEMLGNKNRLSVGQLNQEMKNFDYLKIF